MRRILGVLLFAPLTLAALFIGWMLLPNSLFYRNGRPTRFGKRVNDLSAALYTTRATPRWTATLEVRRRLDERTQRLPVVIAEYDGEEYLVSMLGERSAWVMNVRAAGGKAVIRHGSARQVQLQEVPSGQRAPILKAYLRRAIGARPHFTVTPDAPLGEFERIAAQYPVFRITSDEASRV
jgi:hypothetical protein